MYSSSSCSSTTSHTSLRISEMGEGGERGREGRRGRERERSEREKPSGRQQQYSPYPRVQCAVTQHAASGSALDSAPQRRHSVGGNRGGRAGSDLSASLVLLTVNAITCVSNSHTALAFRTGHRAFSRSRLSRPGFVFPFSVGTRDRAMEKLACSTSKREDSNGTQREGKKR